MSEDASPGSAVTPHELEVLWTWLTYCGAKEAAYRLDLSEQTVKNTLQRIRQRLGVETTAQAVWELRQALEAFA